MLDDRRGAPHTAGHASGCPVPPPYRRRPVHIFALSPAMRRSLFGHWMPTDRKLPHMTAMNRRRFLRNTAAAVAGLAIAPRVFDWRATAAASTLSPAGTTYP